MTGAQKTKPHGGNREASENTTAWTSDSGAQHSPQQATALMLALFATDAACAQLDRYALATDAPAWTAVEAANLLDAARAMLTRSVTP